ncbi:MAG TPA: YegS/Rv2252/BmrU family lipid kinase [Ktedonobacteraceae bacterium]|nr:YegS/Rv2252/BmrU family lipid kinase [Ktedonobacteraceae bacterium]
MRCKKASLVINPRTGQNVAQLSDVMAVLYGAGWKVDTLLKEYGGQTMELANDAAKNGCDMVIAYGGDGTLNQVINGVMNTKGKHKIVGLIPGGTANEWAFEVGIPTDAVKAALTLVDSEVRKVDVGRVGVRSLTFPDASAAVDESQAAVGEQKQHKKKVRQSDASSQARHHFLLMAGLGIDAAVMGNVSKNLKYQIGHLAVGVAAVKELPEMHPFPVEVQVKGGDGENASWKGEALQIVIGNTRRYADVVEFTPDAYIDDGVLDVCVITGGNPLTTMQQIFSLLLRRKPDNVSAEYFRGAHLSITVPSNIHLHLDGSTVKLKDYLGKADYGKLEDAGNAEQVMVTYCFDAMPHALEVAIPHDYNQELFEHSHAEQQDDADSSHEHTEPRTKEQEEHRLHQHSHDEANADEQELSELAGSLLEHGRKVTVVGTTASAGKKHSYVIAGHTPKRSSGEAKPVAVVVNDKTTIFDRNGQHVPSTNVQEMQEGAVIVVEGKQSKRGVIKATRMVI